MLNEFITKKLSEGVLRQLKDLRNVNTYIVAVVHNDGTEINSNAIISMNDLKAYDTVVRTPEELTVALSTTGLTSIFIAAPISVDTFSASTGSALSIYGYPLQIEGNISSSATTPVKFFNVVNCTSSEFLNNADMHFRWLNGSVSKGLAANGAIYYENSSAILPAESFTFELWDNTVNFSRLPLASTSEYGVVKIAPDSDLGFDEHGNLTLTVGQDFFKYLKIGVEMADASGSENIMEFVPSDDIEMSISAGGIINLALAEIEGVEGSYGEDSDMAIQLDNGGSFNIPYLQISPTGRVIASKNVEFVLPSLLGTVGEIDVTFDAGNITFSLNNAIKDLIAENSDLLDIIIGGDSVTFYLDVVNGDDSNSGLSRSMPMKTVAAVVALARSMAGGDYNVGKYRLTILGEGETISFDGATHTNTVLFNTNDFRSDPYIPATDDLLPFQVITSEDRGASLIFANTLKITGDALFIGCKGSVTVANGSDLNVSGNVYVKAKNLTLTSSGKIGGGSDTIVDVTGTLEMSYGGGISCGGDIVVNAKNIKILNADTPLSNGGSRYFRALKDITVDGTSSSLGAASGITDIEAGNNILIRNSTGVVSAGGTYPFNMRAGNDITIHTTGGLCNSKGTNIVAGGTVRIADTIMPYGVNITAKNITDVIDEDIKGGVIVGESLNKALRWEASDTIELYATLVANNDPSVGCYFKAYRMKLGGNYFRISGDVSLESYILQPHYITNSGVRQDYPFIANTNLTVKTAILTHNHEDYPNMAGQIAIFEVTENSRKNRVQITADLITEDVQIAISGDFNAYIEANKIISTQLFNLNLQECVQNGCDRRVIDKSRLLPAYDAVIASRLDLEWHTGANNMLAKDLKEALESPIIESIYLSEPVSLDEDVVLGHDKILYGEVFSYSGVMTGAFTVKFFNHLAMNGGTFSCAEVYSRTSNGDLTIGGTCNFYYERRLSGTVTVGETASYSYMAWETETYAVADEETITGGAALGTDLKVLNAPVIRQLVINMTGETILKGTPVALTGTSGESITIEKLVSSTTIREQENVGVVDADILPYMEGYAVRSGEITMDTNLWTEGDSLYASTTAGVLTNLRPSKGYGVIPVGTVIKKDGINAGKVLVNPSSVPRISQLPDVDIVDPLPNQVLGIGDDGLVHNRFITFIARYFMTENAEIHEEFEKGSVVICFRGYSYSEYLPLIRRIVKTSYPDPQTYSYVFGAVHSGRVVEITCDPEDGWSVLEKPVGGDYQLKGPWAVGVDYEMNDFCTFGDNLYICKGGYTSDAGSDDPSIDTNHWELFFSGSSSTYQLKGPWAVGISYIVNDFCTFGGDLYICKSAYTSDPESDNPSIDTDHWEIFFEASLAQEIGFAASGDALGANASISLQAGSSAQWSAHGVISSSTSKLTPEVGTSLLGCVVSQVVAGGHFIIAAYKVESGGTHSLICSTGVLDMPASAGWLNGTVDLISSTNKFVPPNELIYFVIMTDINGASVAGSSASGNLNLQPYASAIKTNMGVLTEAPATLTFEGETPLRPFVFLRK